MLHQHDQVKLRLKPKCEALKHGRLKAPECKAEVKTFKHSQAKPTWGANSTQVNSNLGHTH